MALNDSDVNILVIDDEQGNLEIIATTFKNLAYKLYYYDNIPEAKQQLLSKNKKFHLIILDMMLPEINGWDFLKDIKNNPELKNIPVIAQSSAVSDQEVQSGLEAGAETYLTKPYSKEQIITATKDTLDQFYS